MTGVRSELLLAAVLAAMLALGLSLGLCVQDDTYISLRYAHNLVEGHGLVFNPGEEPVEGYTNFLWTVMLAAVMALGGNGVLASVVGGLLSAGLLGWVTWRYGRDSPSCQGRPLLVLLAPALVVLDPGLLLESVQGLESVFFTLLVTGCAALTIREMEDSDRVPWSGLVGGLAALTRPEGYLFYGLLQVARVFHRPVRPPGAVRIGWLVFGMFAVSHLVYRWTFYGDIVPNTFHAKTGGGPEMWERGLHYVGEFAYRHLGLVIAGLIGAWVAVRRGAARDMISLLLVSVMLVYVVSVGGDFKHSGRFLLPVLPLMALWAQDGLARVLDELEHRRLPAWLGGAAVLSLCLHNGLQYWPIASGAATFRVVNQDERIAVGEFLRMRFAPDTRIAIHSAGTVPYISNLPTIDCWGLSDRHIARVEVEDMGKGTPGHEKTDYEYVFRKHPTVYLPEKDLVTAEPSRLLVPMDFPETFEGHYDQRSNQLQDGRWVNYWLHIPEPDVPAPADDLRVPVTPR